MLYGSGAQLIRTAGPQTNMGLMWKAVSVWRLCPSPQWGPGSKGKALVRDQVAKFPQTFEHICSLCTEASSALEVLQKCTIQIYYLLTYVQSPPEADDILLVSHRFVGLYSTFKLKSGTNINVAKHTAHVKRT